MGVDVSGWPDSDKPGYPLDPETDGWHWLQRGSRAPMPCKWSAPTKIKPDFAWGNDGGIEFTIDCAGHDWTYLGPALTPAEVEDVVHMIGMAAAEAMNRILADMQTEGETKH